MSPVFRVNHVLGTYYELEAIANANEPITQ